MFLWVRLVVEELRNCFSDWDLEEKANSLPKGLDEAYLLLRLPNESNTNILLDMAEYLTGS
jgi:hypothetical protein